MVSYTVNAGVGIRDYRGKSTDDKPVLGVPNGSTFYEMDGEHDVYMFDAEARVWMKQ